MTGIKSSVKFRWKLNAIVRIAPVVVVVAVAVVVVVADAVGIIVADEHITAQITIIILSKPMEEPIVFARDAQSETIER